MAQRVITQLISDLSGDEVVEGKGETVEFTYRGNSYTKVRPSCERWRRSLPERTAEDPRVGAGNGYEVSERGRNKADVVAAYHSAN